MESHYKRLAKFAQDSVSLALTAANDTLPALVKRQHWIIAKHSPAAWRAVEAWYRIHPDCEPAVLQTVTDLALLSEALSCLLSLTTEDQQTPLNLRVAKTRRSA